MRDLREEKLDTILSIDYDGCKAQEPEEGSALEKLAQEATTILVGSNRQSHGDDISNSTKHSNDSCFPHFLKYGEKFHPLLAADIQLQQPAGFTLDQAADEKFAMNSDEYKRTLIYSQIQAMVEFRKGQDLSEEFVFQFVDDREDILEALNNFFCDNPKFIPKGVTLQLFRYSPEEEISEPKQFGEPIHGRGKADANYVNTSNAISKYVDTITFMNPPNWMSNIGDAETLEKTLESYKTILRAQITKELHGEKQVKTAESSEEIKSTHDIKLSRKDEEDITHIRLYAESVVKFEPREIAFNRLKNGHQCATSELFSIVTAFTAVSSKYSGSWDYYNPEMASPNQLSFKIEAKANEPHTIPEKLLLMFTYDIDKKTWDVKPSQTVELNEEEAYIDFLYGYYDTLSPEAQKNAIQPSLTNNLMPNDALNSDMHDELLVSPASLPREDVDSFETCYSELKDLQQKLMDLYSEENFRTKGNLREDESIDQFSYIQLGEEDANETKDTICTTTGQLNALENKIFKILTHLDKQHYLDDPQGNNFIEQLLDKDTRNQIIQRRKDNATYNPRASTLTCLEEYRSTFIGSHASSQNDPCLWISARPNLIEDLFDAATTDHNKKRLSKTDQAKTEWLKDVKTLLHGIIDTKNSLIVTYKNLSKEEKYLIYAEKLKFEKYSQNLSTNNNRVDKSLEKILEPRKVRYGLSSLKAPKVRYGLSSLKAPSDGMNWQNAAMVGGAILGFATMAVLTCGTGPAGMAILGAAGYATWQVVLMFAASGGVGALLGWGGNKMANAWPSKANTPLKAKPPQSLEEELKEYSTQQLRKAFFSTINEERPSEIDRRKAVRKEILGPYTLKLFNRMFEPADDNPQRDGDYTPQSPQRKYFDRNNFCVPDNPDAPLAINPENHLAHPREIAHFYATLDQDGGIHRRVMAAMKNSPWIKRELATFLVHAVLFNNATEADRELATQLMKDDKFNNLREALFYPSPSANGNEENEQLSFFKSFISQIDHETNQGSQLPIPSSDNESRNALLTMIKKEIQQQGHSYTKKQALIKESHEQWRIAYTCIPKEDLKKLLLCSCLPTEENNLYMDLQRNKGYLQINGRPIIDDETFKKLSKSNDGSSCKSIVPVTESNFFTLLDGEDLESDSETKKNMLNFLSRHLSTTGTSLVASLESLIQDAFNHMQLPPRQADSLISIPMESSSNISDAQYSSENSVEKTINIKREGNKLIFTTDLCYYGYSKEGDASSRFLGNTAILDGEVEYIKLHGDKAVIAKSEVTVDFSLIDESGNPQLILDETFANVHFDTKLLEKLNSPLPQDVVREKNRANEELVIKVTKSQIDKKIRELSNLAETLENKIASLTQGHKETKGQELEDQPSILSADAFNTLSGQLKQQHEQLIKAYKDKLSHDQKEQLIRIQQTVDIINGGFTVGIQYQRKMADEFASETPNKTAKNLSSHGIYKEGRGEKDLSTSPVRLNHLG